jgi:hypothetical protein
MRIGVVMPVGPHAADVEACRDTLRSIVAWEPAVETVAFVDDGPPARDLVAAVSVENLRLVALPHPLADTEASVSQRIAAAVLAGLGWLAEHTMADVMMKIDTDALAIAPSPTSWRRRWPTRALELVGSYGRSCTGETRSFAPCSAHLQETARLVQPRRRALGARAPGAPAHPGGPGRRLSVGRARAGLRGRHASVGRRGLPAGGRRPAAIHRHRARR